MRIGGLHMHTVMHREARVAPGEQAICELGADALVLYKQPKHRLAKGLGDCVLE